jgi:hypothetical protein
VLRNLEVKRDALKKQVDHLRTATPQAETLDDVQEALRVYRILREEHCEERTELRQRLRARIAELVESIDVLLYREADDYWLCADAQINFRAGKSLLFHISDSKDEKTMSGCWWVDEPSEDLRNYDPKKYERRWDERQRHEREKKRSK